MTKKVIVGLSGGVDSSVSALLLKQQAYQVEGLFMKNWEADDEDDYCTSQQDLADAQAVCSQLQIPLHAVNFSKQYWDKVFAYFLQEYQAGRTPNPDVLCNKEIKFKAFLDYALQLGADFIATGHYARVVPKAGSMHLCKSADPDKDQTYFLYLLNQQQLAKSLFPLAAYTKNQVRALAQQHGLITHAKKDSTGICFIGERKFKDFLEQYLPAKPGPIETPEGIVIGQHSGLMFYTIGQRQGLHIGGRSDSPEAPWYVAKKDVQRNVLIVVQGQDHPWLYASSLRCDQVHWISGDEPALPLTCTAKIRYRQAEQSCTVTRHATHQLLVTFDSPQRAITAGQSVVFYRDNDCLGGGIII